MLRGIYTSATGMVAEMDRQNVIANNLANVNTVGYKRDNCTTVPFAEILLNAYSKRGPVEVGKLGLGVQAVTQFVDFTAGAMSDTGNMTDMAIEGDGLFAVQTGSGVRYSRAGNFQLDKNNYLVTKEGYQVLGQNGPIKITGKSFTVTDDGEIYQSANPEDNTAQNTDSQAVTRLQIFNKQGMVKQGDTLYSNNQEAVPASTYRVHQGMLEHSNVNVVREMIEMINNQRSYDTGQKALMAHDDTLNTLITGVSK